MRSRASRTSTRMPACARYAAHVRPLCPAPTTTASHGLAASSLTGAGSPIRPRSFSARARARRGSGRPESRALTLSGAPSVGRLPRADPPRVRRAGLRATLPLGVTRAEAGTARSVPSRDRGGLVGEEDAIPGEGTATREGPQSARTIEPPVDLVAGISPQGARRRALVRDARGVDEPVAFCHPRFPASEIERWWCDARCYAPVSDRRFSKSGSPARMLLM